MSKLSFPGHWISGRRFHEGEFAVGLVYLLVVASYLAPTKNVANAVLYVMAAVSLVSFFGKKDRFVELAAREWMLVAFIVLTAVGAFFEAPDQVGYALRQAGSLLFAYLFVLLFREVITLRLRAILFTIVLSSVCWSLVLLVPYLQQHGFHLTYRQIDVVYGPIDQIIRTSNVLAVGFLLALWLAYRNSAWLRWICLASTIPLLYTLLLFNSRGALLALCVGIAVVVFYRLYENVSLTRRLFVTLSILLGLMFLLALFIWGYNPKGVTDDPRLHIWRSALSQIDLGNLWFGRGYTRNQEIPTVIGGDSITFCHVHNNIISVLRFGGIVGLALFLGYGMDLLRRALNTVAAEPHIALLFGWIALGLVAGFFNGRHPVHIAPDPFMTLWLPLALLAAVTEQREV